MCGVVYVVVVIEDSLVFFMSRDNLEWVWVFKVIGVLCMYEVIVDCEFDWWFGFFFVVLLLGFFG